MNDENPIGGSPKNLRWLLAEKLELLVELQEELPDELEEAKVIVNEFWKELEEDHCELVEKLGANSNAQHAMAMNQMGNAQDTRGGYKKHHVRNYSLRKHLYH